MVHIISAKVRKTIDKSGQKRNFVHKIFIIKHCLLFLLFLFATLSHTSANHGVKYEGRAVWLTTLSGLDWPHSKDIDSQKQELCSILDRLADANFNMVFFQTRIRHTVIYPSYIEPWDMCLTGRHGRSPGYDPLAFAVEECHRRGMQLHAWVVAFPAPRSTDQRMGKLAIQHRHPELCMKATNGWMLNPGIPATADYLAGICAEITTNYDIDGIHLDYIRYPEHSVTFNDNNTYRQHARNQGKAQWRRENINHCVQTIYQTVKSIKPWVCLSCSPIGKYDNLPRQHANGWNAFHTGCQDAQLWIQQEWMDMLVPMMYFKANHNFFPFAFDWKEASCGHPVLNGLGAYFLHPKEKSGNWNLSELEREMNVSRIIQSGGQCFFRSQFVTENTKGLYDFLKNRFYRLPALPPPLAGHSYLTPHAPKNARLVPSDTAWTLMWDKPDPTDGPSSLEYTLYCSDTWPIDTLHAENLLAIHLKDTQYRIPKKLPLECLPYYAVTATNRYGQESHAAHFNFPSKTSTTSNPIIDGDLLDLSADGTLHLPASSAGLLLITDEYGRTVSIQPYTTVIDTHGLAPGLYTFSTLQRKGIRHTLGHCFIKTMEATLPQTNSLQSNYRRQ